MLFYWSIFVLLALFAYLEVICKRVRFFDGLFAFFVFFFFVLSFIRWETGTDWDSYLSAFNRIRIPWEQFGSKEEKMEIGFQFLNQFPKWIYNDYTLCLFVQAVFVFSFLYFSLMRQSIYPLLSLFIFLSMSFAGIFFVRQTIAMAIVLYSYKYLIHRNKRFFIALVIFASLFHRSAFVFLVAYPLSKLHLEWKTITLYIILSMSLGTVLMSLMLSCLSMFDLGIISQKIAYYSDLGESDNSTIYSTTSIIIRGGLNRTFLLLLYYLYLRYRRLNNSVINVLINIQFIGILLYFVLSPISLTLNRVVVYFDIAQILIIPYVFRYNKGIANKSAAFLIFMLYSIFRYYTALVKYDDAFIPYKTIFD